MTDEHEQWSPYYCAFCEQIRLCRWLKGILNGVLWLIPICQECDEKRKAGE